MTKEWYFRPATLWVMFSMQCALVVYQAGMFAHTRNSFSFCLLLLQMLIMFLVAIMRIWSSLVVRSDLRDARELMPRVVMAANTWLKEAPKADLAAISVILAGAEEQARKLGYHAAGPLLFGAIGLEIEDRVEAEGKVAATKGWTAQGEATK